MARCKQRFGRRTYTFAFARKVITVAPTNTDVALIGRRFLQMLAVQGNCTCIDQNTGVPFAKNKINRVLGICDRNFLFGGHGAATNQPNENKNPE